MTQHGMWGQETRIAISCVSARPEPLAGIGRYVEGLLSGLAATGYGGSVILFATAGSPLPNHNLPSDQVEVEWFAPRKSSLYCLLWHLLVLPHRARRCGAHLLHVTNIKPAARCGVPLAVTVHDAAELEVAGRFDRLRTLYRRLVFYPLARHADVILTVSHVGRQPVARALRRPVHRINVVPNVVDTSRFRPDARLPGPHTLPDRFLLYVGRIEHPNKNLINLTRAYAIARRHQHDLQLLLAGAPSWRAREVTDEVEVTEGAHYLGYVDEGDLPGLLAAAEVFVLPSLHEGFGIPVIEAMASNTPVAAARTGALPEVAGDAAEFFDPEDTQSIAAALLTLITDVKRRDLLLERGRRRVESYTPAIVGAIMRDIYVSVLPASAIQR